MTENEKENMEGTEEKGEKEKSSVGISPLEVKKCTLYSVAPL